MTEEEIPAIEKLGESPEIVERSMQELESAPRVDLNILRNKGHTHTFFIEFEENTAVIKCTINKGISWQKMANARNRAKNVVQKSDGTISAEVDSNALIRDLWNDIVVSTEPRITLAELDTLQGTVASEIVGHIMKEYQKFSPDMKVRKK